MKIKLICSLLTVVALVACGGNDRDKAAAQAEFETVQEGSAAGVTSTIAGPGETIPPMTGTNADTTSAFALTPAAAPTAQPAGGTIAGTFPDPYGIPSTTGTYRPPAVRSAPVRSTPSPQPSERRTDPETESPAPAETTTQTAEPPPTETSTSTPPPAEKKKQSEESEEEPEQTDTAPPPPPPTRDSSSLSS